MDLLPCLSEHIDIAWRIIQDAIAKRKAEGSTQWQDGYPNRTTIENDIQQGHAYIFSLDAKIIGYVALIPRVEPAYADISGAWISEHSNFLVIHRLAFNQENAGKGLARLAFQAIEHHAKIEKYTSIRLDTASDNLPMLALMQQLKYHYCGTIFMRGQPRLAFEKIVEIDPD